VTFCANFPRLSKSRLAVKLKGNLFAISDVDQSTKFAQRNNSENNGTTATADAEHSAPELLVSTAVAWVWIRSAVTSRLMTAIKHLDCAPSFPWQAVSDLSCLDRIHPMMPRCEAVFLLLNNYTVFHDPRQIDRTCIQPARPSAACSE
jgi:hypothetical protein